MWWPVSWLGRLRRCSGAQTVGETLDLLARTRKTRPSEQTSDQHAKLLAQTARSPALRSIVPWIRRIRPSSLKHVQPAQTSVWVAAEPVPARRPGW
jgi:hypothetical protein